MKVVLPRSGPGVEAPPFLGYVVLFDLLVAAALVVAGPVLALGNAFSRWPWLGWAMCAYGVVLVLVDLAAARMSPKGLTWRRRLGYLAIVAVAWRGSPLSAPEIAVPVVLYEGFVWVALVVGGRALSRSIATATGEDKPE